MAFSEQQKSIYNLVANGGAFKNPHSTNLNDLTSAIDQAIADADNISNFTPEEIETIKGKLEEFKTSVNGFLTHTNRISGVTLSNLGPLPSAHALLSVCRSIEQQYENLGLSPDDGKDEGLKLFGALYDILDTDITNMKAYVNTIITYVDAPSGALRTEEDIINEIDSYIGSFSDQITLDNDNFDVLVSSLRNSALSYELLANISYPGWIDVLLNRITSDDLKNLL